MVKHVYKVTKKLVIQYPLSYYQTTTKKIALVNVYDSLNLEPGSQEKSQICAILKYEGTIVTVNKVPVQRQHGSVDCGLFAITNTVALCFGYEPNKMLFHQDRMRNHLISCFDAGQFYMFL